MECATLFIMSDMGNDFFGVTRLTQAVESLENALSNAKIQTSHDADSSSEQLSQLKRQNAKLQATQVTVKKRLDALISKFSSIDEASL